MRSTRAQRRPSNSLALILGKVSEVSSITSSGKKRGARRMTTSAPSRAAARQRCSPWAFVRPYLFRGASSGGSYASAPARSGRCALSSSQTSSPAFSRALTRGVMVKLVVEVWTVGKPSARTLAVPVTLAASNSRACHDNACGAWSAAQWNTAPHGWPHRLIASGSATSTTSSTVAPGTTSTPTTATPSFCKVMCSAAPRYPALPVSSTDFSQSAFRNAAISGVSTNPAAARVAAERWISSHKESRAGSRARSECRSHRGPSRSSGSSVAG
mmetsp:Transcript_35828/g.108275  ORF Transcript_35828/g.108275 Transcript_35828/m.108275 type:complete len:271 (+) Transcript_35828:181-993(+)